MARSRMLYEQGKPYRLKREERWGGVTPPQQNNPRLMARQETGVIEIDSLTTLRGVPPVDLLARICTVSVETMKIVGEMPQ